MAEDVFGIVGSVIAGAYHVECVVAEAGLGVVYRARHGELRAPVALKLLKVPQQDPQQQADFLARFRAEVQLVLRLSNSLPTVVRPLHADAFMAANGRFVPYLALEWLEGVTLDALIKQRSSAGLPPVPLRKLVRLLTPVARALDRAHHFSGPEGTQCIVHRDLKPANIFVAQVAGAEVVKISDFGMGKVKSVVSQVAARMSPTGSAPLAFAPAYGAPEQWAPRRYGQTGSWTDVWSLALCMVEVLAGRAVMEGEPATMMGITLDASRRPTPRSKGVQLPDAVEAVFARALALEPRARQQDAGQFWDELVAALALPLVEVESAADTDLEFDLVSASRASQASQRTALAAEARLVSARAVTPVPAPVARAVAAPRAPAAIARAAAVSGAHFVPDLELAPPSVARRASSAQLAVQQVSQPSVLELDDAAGPSQSLDLALDLPADEPRPQQRTVSSQRLVAVQPPAQRPSRPPPRGFSGSLAAVREPMASAHTSGALSTRSSTPELALAASETSSTERGSVPPARSARGSVPPGRSPSRGSIPPPSPLPGSFEVDRVARFELNLPAERSFTRRLRPALVLICVAVLVAILDPIYAAASGEVLRIFGLRSSLFAGALLLLAMGLALRELVREN